MGARFSAVLLDLAGVSQLLALFFAMCIAILLGMAYVYLPLMVLPIYASLERLDLTLV